MRTDQHPEYPAYQRDQIIFQGFQAALADWEAGGQPVVVAQYGLRWEPASARALAQSLSGYLRAYNQVLWQEFPYCRSCRGQCCVVNGATIEPFDLLALALLDSSLPVLPERIPTEPHDCIYHTPGRCTWPAAWRTQKCWLFYCLGPLDRTGTSESASPSIGERYKAIAQTLDRSLAGLLPAPLRIYEQHAGIRFHDWLDRPLSYSKILTQALLHIFLNEFLRAYPLIEKAIPVTPTRLDPDWLEISPQDSRIEEILASLQEIGQSALVYLAEDAPEFETDEIRLWDDLETLEWIVLGWPENSPALLEEIYQYYSRPPRPMHAEHPLCMRMRDLALEIRQELRQQR